MAYFDPDGQTVSVESLRLANSRGARESSVEVEGGEAMHYPPQRPSHPSHVPSVPTAPPSGDHVQMQAYLEQQAILQQQQQIQLQQLQQLQLQQMQQLQAQQAPPGSHYPYPPPHVRMSAHPESARALAAAEGEPPESNRVKFLAMGLAIGAVVVLLLSGNGLNQIRASLAYALMPAPATPAPAAQPPAMPTVPPPPPAAPVAVAPALAPAPVAVVAAPATRPIPEVEAARLPHAAPVAHAGTKKPPRAPKEEDPDAPGAPAAGAEPVPGSIPLDIGAFSKGLGNAFKGGDSLGGGGF